MRTAFRILAASATLFAVTLALPNTATAQWSTTYEQFYLQAPHNWVFRTHFAHADRLFNAFDFGHAILYETLWRFPDRPASELEEKRYNQLVHRILPRPPRLPLEEAAIEPMYMRLAPEAKIMFEWAHLLHRQLYDILADERLSWPQKDEEVARLLAYYRSRPDLAFSSRPKSMALMQEQPYSLAFRKKYPKFNGLIWGYHWLQVGLYEPLMVGRNAEERQAGVRATVARFWQMLQDAPRHMPHQMPMTAPVAPTFAARYPEAAIIFDNLHSMHDVISDILANPSVPRNRKREEILRAAVRFRDDTTEIMSVNAWKQMSAHMGVENMGGPAVGFLPQLPAPTVTYGAVMQHDRNTGAMIGFLDGSATGGDHDAHAGHVMPPDTSTAQPVAAQPVAADVKFMQGMIGHHAQAVEMSELAATRTTSRDMLALAERIRVSQQDEIEIMQRWLRRNNQPVPPANDSSSQHAGHDAAHGAAHGAAHTADHAMPGMLTPAQMDSLRAATERSFDALFLRYMIQHHEGALRMVADLLATPRGAHDALVYQFAVDVDAGQRAEIRRMRAMLEQLGAPAR